MTRTEWVERIQRGWRELDELVAALDAQALEAPVAGGWTVKDHLAHLAAWEESLVALLEGRDRAAAVGVSGVGEGDVDRVNAAIWERHRDESPEQAVSSLRDTHRRLLARLDQLGEEDLSRPYSHYQPGPSSDPDHEKPVSDWVGVNTFEHYAEHVPLIRSGRSKAGLGPKRPPPSPSPRGGGNGSSCDLPLLAFSGVGDHYSHLGQLRPQGV